MSHEIGTNDKQQGTSMAWHNLTEVLPVILLRTCFLAAWDVVKRPLFRPVPGSEPVAYVPTDTSEIVCTDDQNIIVGKPVDPSYHLLTNGKFLTLVQSAMDRIAGAIVASVGSVCNRGRIFVTIEVPEIKSFMAAGREFKPFLNFLSSHDKSCPFTVNLSTICTVCNNTFGMNLRDEENDTLRIRVKHTSGMPAMLEDVPEIIAAYFTSVQKFAEVMDKLAQMPVSEADAKAFFAAFTTEKTDDSDKSKAEKSELSTRRLNQINRLTELFLTGKGNKGKDLSDLFQAVTDYYSHENSGNVDSEDAADKFKQLASSEFGTGQAMKAYAFAILQDDKKTAGMIAKGHKVLAVVPAA